MNGVGLAGQAKDPDASDRPLGFWPCLALVVGTIIGSGIFLLPAQLAPFGWNAVLGWLVTIGGALCIAFVFARLAAAIPEAAGPHAFVGQAFGRLAAFGITWAYWIAIWVGNAAIAIAAVSYGSLFAPALADTPILGAGAAIGLLWLLTALNCVSLKASGGFQMITALLKLLPLLAVVGIAVAVMVGGGESQAPPFRPEEISLDAINGAAAISLWAMLGFEAAAWASRNVRDPARNVPRATFYGTLAVGLFYLAVTTAVMLLTPPDQLAASNAPLALAIEPFAGAGIALIFGLLAAISVMGSLNGLVLIQGELPLQLARDGALPGWLGKVSRRGLPVRAQIVSSALSTALILANASRSLSGLFAFMALVATAATLVLYLVVAGAAVELQRRNRVETSPLLLVTAGIGILFALWTFYGAGFEASAWTLGLIAAGFPIYGLTRWSGSRPPAAAPPALRE